MKNVMIDIETLGNKPYSVILSIAAVVFDLKTGETFEKFNVSIDPQSCEESGLKLNASTVTWWLNQSKVAQLTFLNSEKVHFASAMLSFKSFIESIGTEFFIWSNSPSFDLSLLKNAFDTGLSVYPWQFWQEMDVRTITNLCPEFKQNHVWTGVAHDPLTDCENQIQYLVKTYNHLFK